MMGVDGMDRKKEDNKRRIVEMVFFDGELEKVLKDIGVPVTDYNKHVLLYEFKKRMYDAIRGKKTDVKEELRVGIVKDMTDFSIED